MLKKIHKMVLDDRRLKVRELADMAGISKSVVHRILDENLDMRKLCARWVPRFLTMEQIQRLEDVSIECLAMFYSNKTVFFASIHNHEWNMSPSLHTWDEGTVKTMDWKGKIGSKEGEDTSAVPIEKVVSRTCYRGESRASLRLVWDITHSRTMPRLPAEIPEHRN